MQTLTLFRIVWRLVLAISLATAPLVTVQAAHHEDAAAETTATAAAMPCHDMPAPPPADDAPCDDGCCPMPDCDPGACRMPGSLFATVIVLPALPPALPRVSFRAPAVIALPVGQPLRPPIA